MRVLQRLFDPAYLYSTDPGPLGQWGLVYFAWAAALLAGGAAAAWWRTQSQEKEHRLATGVTVWACGAGVLFLILRLVSPLARYLPTYARYLLLEVWTARVWPISATLLGVLTALVALLSRLGLPRIVQRHVAALTGSLSWDDPPLPRWQSILLGIVHLGGLACLWHTAGRTVAWAPVSVFVLSLLPMVARGHRARLETLVPLFPAYLGAVASLLMARWLGVDVGEYQLAGFPDPLSPWFNAPALIIAGVAYVLWIQAHLLTQHWPARNRRRVLPAVLAVVTGLWLIGTVIVHRTHGVTASDPYCYAQMTVDLARTGSPLHDFPLAGLARDLGLPTWPTVHVGYHPPFFGNRSPTMWPIGWPVLMAPFYWAGGLEALYWTAPVANALALVCTWCLANEALHRERPAVRWVTAALTCLLVATSPEGSERMLVPMADAAAQLFTVLALWLIVRARRQRPGLHGLLAGASFGIAYWLRHPQLPLGVSALVVAFVAPQSGTAMASRKRIRLLAAFGVMAFLVALGDLAYHQRVFGHWLNTESTEWFLLSWRNIGPSFFSVVQQGLLRPEEIGLLAPFAAYGAWLMWRRHRPVALVLGSACLAVFVFHLFYAALRPRDLIAILPLLYSCVAYGFVTAWRWGQQRRWLATALLLVCCATFLGARSHDALAMPWRSDVVTFGHISADQRGELDALRALTPGDAIIGSMLNGGAIELHAERQAIHPAPWSEEELGIWTEAVLSRGRPFYVLDDGEEMAPVLAKLRARYVLHSEGQLGLPYFAIGGGNLPRVATLYRVERAD